MLHHSFRSSERISYAGVDPPFPDHLLLLSERKASESNDSIGMGLILLRKPISFTKPLVSSDDHASVP